jgi:hypothetical protein
MKRVAVGVLVVGLALGCQNGTPPPPADGGTALAVPETGPTDLPGLHNVLRLSDTLFSGSSPDGEEGFRSLRRLAVRTVISVDGARPGVEAARKFGLRYVHLPVGYDGIPRDRALQLARAVRDLPGPAYVHCHHGKHRGPAAAVAVQLCLDERCSVEQAETLLKRAGTDPRYTGLIGLPRSLARPRAAELDRAAADFPEVATVSDLARLMVAIDTRFENFKLIRKADWRKPPDHPDLDPPHEALQLAEQYREAARLPLPGRPDELRLLLGAAAGRVEELERLLRPVRGTGPAVEAVFQQVQSACGACHVRHRDTPRDATGSAVPGR